MGGLCECRGGSILKPRATEIGTHERWNIHSQSVIPSSPALELAAPRIAKWMKGGGDITHKARQIGFYSPLWKANSFFSSHLEFGLETYFSTKSVFL